MGVYWLKPPLEARYVLHWRYRMNVLAIVGKLLPWAVGAVAGLLTLLGVLPSWWPTVAAFLTGLAQFFIALGPKAPAK